MNDVMFTFARDASNKSASLVSHLPIQERVRKALQDFDGTVIVEAGPGDRIYVYARKTDHYHRTSIDADWLLAQNFDGFENLIRNKFLTKVY